MSRKGKKDGGGSGVGGESIRDQKISWHTRTPKIDDTAGIMLGSLLGVIVGFATGLIHGSNIGICLGTGTGLAILFAIETMQSLVVSMLAGSSAGVIIGNLVHQGAFLYWGLSEHVILLDSVMIGVIFGVVVGWSVSRHVDGDNFINNKNGIIPPGVASGATTVSLWDFPKFMY